MDNNYIIKINELDPNRKIDYQLHLKPKFTIYMFLVIGIALIVGIRNIPALIIGGLFILFPLINIFFIKDRVIFECNDEGCIAYDMNDLSSAYQFKWDDVVIYSRESTANNAFAIQFILNGDQTVIVPSSSEQCFSTIGKYIPEKNKMTKWKNDQLAKQKARKEEKKQKKA